MPFDGLPTFDLSSSPTVYNYVMCDTFVSGITGPVGSGKSVGSCIKILRHAAECPISHNGYRRCRAVVIRNTYPELKSTTIKTWEDIFIGYRVAPIVYGAPIRHHIKLHPSKNFKWEDKAAGLYMGHPGLDLEVWFLALDRPADVAHLKSLECTFAFINEGSEINEAILDMLTVRVGRFPKKDDIPFGEPFAGIFYDTNAADETNWSEDYATNTPPKIEVELEDGTVFEADWSFFRQVPAILEVDAHNVITEPGDPLQGREVRPQTVMSGAGRRWTINPAAENLQNLKRGYYQQAITNKTLDWIQRYLQAKTIYIAEGKPWVPEFSQLHFVKPLAASKSMSLMIGIDAGGGTLNPAAVWGQVSPLGDWRILSELVIEDIGLDRFVAALKRHHAQKFPGHAIQAVYVDPAAATRDEVYETAVEDYLRNARLPVQLAPTNDQKIRRDAIALPMGRNVVLPSGHLVPGLLIDPSCSKLIAALAGKWYKKVVERVGSKSVSDKPVKNEYSHPGDALGYLLCGGGEYEVLVSNRKPGSNQTPLRERARMGGGAVQINVKHDI